MLLLICSCLQFDAIADASFSAEAREAFKNSKTKKTLKKSLSAMRLGALAGAFDFIFCHLPVLLATQDADTAQPLTKLTLEDIAACPLVCAIAGADGGRGYISALTPARAIGFALQTTRSHHPTEVVYLHCLHTMTYQFATSTPSSSPLAHGNVFVCPACCLYYIVSCKNSC